ncbi:MAG: hypothetical protein AAF490_20575 [Chloroflexota bacterium]
MSDFSELSTTEVEEKLKKAKTTQTAVAIIFGLIVLAWIVLGYWRTNVPVFVTTLAMSTIIIITTRNNTQSLEEEIKKRNASNE